MYSLTHFFSLACRRFKTPPFLHIPISIMKANKPKWDTPDGHSPLVAFLSQFGALSKEVIEEIDVNTFPLFIKKKKLILI